MNEEVYFAAKAAEEARVSLKQTRATAAVQDAAAAEAYLNNLPTLDTVSSIRTYVACIAHGVKRGYLAAPQARLLLHAAQLALAAHTRKVQPC